ncbi:MAG: winged helix-turn-helix domain-containing protein [Candidatus Bathyarchaeia archaeon]
MISKRSRLELYLEVLRAISKGVSKPTNIMYKMQSFMDKL